MEKTDIIAKSGGIVGVSTLVLSGGGQRVIGKGDNVPPKRASQRVEVLFGKGAVSFRRIVDAVCEDIIRCRWTRCGLRRDRGIRCPVNDGEDAMRRLARNDGFIPVILHLNFELEIIQKRVDEISLVCSPAKPA